MNILRNILLIIIVLASGQVMSTPISTPMPAIHLFSACKESDTKEYSRGFCDGAIDALYSSIPDWCVPSTVTHGEIRKYIKSELLKSVPLSSISAFDFVNRAVLKRWPCS